MRVIEPYAVIDTFVCGLAKVEILKHGNVRFTYFAEVTGLDGEPEMHVVAKLVIAKSAIGEARRIANLALYGQLPTEETRLAAAAH